MSLSDGRSFDVTADELVALQHEIRAHLLYRVASSRGRFSNSGG
ncbi:hypothetical protein [Embleya scabrispora]|nr:hypothetical protein [Embleya scabrispora]